jgi:hypothetical protein
MRPELLAVALAASLVLVGGAAAVTSTAPMDATGQETPREAHPATSYDDGTLTVVVTNDGEPVENALVNVGEDDREREFVTDENGTVVAEDVRATDELEVEAEVPTFEAKHEYHVDGDSLTLLEAEYEYPRTRRDGGRGRRGPRGR